MSDDWKLTGHTDIVADFRYFTEEEIETLRKKLIEDIDYVVAFWRNKQNSGDEMAKYYIDAFLSCKHNINERFGVEE